MHHIFQLLLFFIAIIIILIIIVMRLVGKQRFVGQKAPSSASQAFQNLTSGLLVLR